MKLIDTNVFMYAIGGEHAYRECCRRLLASATTQSIDAMPDIEVFQEILHRYHSTRMTHRGVRIVTELLISFPDSIPISVRVMSRAAQLLRTYPHVESRDAVHAAVVLEHGMEGIISADSGFDGIAGLTRFDPREF